MKAANMRTEPKLERLRVASLKELDALVGRYLTKESPQVFWEEQQVCLRFDSLEEALEAMRDPYFQEFIPKGSRSSSALTEVQEFRPYSSDLLLAWEVVEQLSAEADALSVRREEGRWMAAFGDRPPAISRSAPVAICLAALRTRGIEVELIPEWTSPAVHASNSAAA
jgi:hypothetical protein